MYVKGHGRAVHVLVARHEVHRALPQLSPLLVVLPQPHFIERRVVTVVRGVQVTAEVADPLQPVLYEANEGVHLGPAVLAPQYRFLPEGHRHHALPSERLPEGLDYHADGKLDLLQEGIRIRHTVCCHPQH